MSRWTHVAGIIRIDNLGRFVGKMETIEDIVKLFEKDAPNGSEGGLMVHGYNSQQHEDTHIGTMMTGSLNWATITFEGDLRDYGDDENDITKILEWVKKNMKKIDEMAMVVRQATFIVEVDYKTHVTYSWIEKNGEIDQKWMKYEEPDHEWRLPDGDK